jgi:hypothetical protein
MKKHPTKNERHPIPQLFISGSSRIRNVAGAENMSHSSKNFLKGLIAFICNFR